MNTNQNEFIESLDGNITAEQLDQLLELGEGDTGALSSEKAAQPGAAATVDGGDTEGANSESTAAAAEAAAAAGKGQATAQESAGQPELNADNAVVLTKDGKHTISYDVLVEAQQGVQHWKTEAAAKDARIAELEAQAAARAEAGEAPTTQDNQLKAAQAAIEQGVNPELFGDFSEEALAKGIQTLVAQQVAAQVQTHVTKALEPLQAKAAEDATAKHYGAIYEAHPNADSIVESREFADWLASQPSMARAAYMQVLDPEKGGAAQQVIELFDAFTKATGATQQGASTEADVRSKAQAAIAQAKAPVPTSLSDIPGGRAAGVTREDAMADMDGAELLESMDGMSREQIDAFLNRL